MSGAMIRPIPGNKRKGCIILCLLAAFVFSSCDNDGISGQKEAAGESASSVENDNDIIVAVEAETEIAEEADTDAETAYDIETVEEKADSAAETADNTEMAKEKEDTVADAADDVEMTEEKEETVEDTVAETPENIETVEDKEDTADETADNTEMAKEKEDTVADAADETETAEEDKAEEKAPAEGEAEETPEQFAEGFTKSKITDDIKKRITGLSYAADCTVPYEDLRYLRVMYVNFGGSKVSGEIICNKVIADDLLQIFKGLYDEGYQIDKIRLIDEYGADDDLSCADDNTSCFCFRKVYGSKNLSKHALGMAVDINPFYNPYVTYPNGNIRISPPGSEPYADRNADFPHKIDKNDLAYKLFTAHGFKWGGDWNSLKDYQHFQKG